MYIHCTNPECCNFRKDKPEFYRKKGFYHTENGSFQRCQFPQYPTPDSRIPSADLAA
jgi:hypothetical protein